MSEEFGGALPTAIWAEQQRLPVGFLERVIEYRAYAHAVALNEADPRGWKNSDLRTLAKTIELELVAEARERARQAQEQATG